MGNWSDFLDRFFKKNSPKRSEIPFLHEAIDLKNYPLQEYNAWFSSGKWDAFSELVAECYRNRLITGNSRSENVSLLSSSHANGWLIHCHKLSYSHSDYKHLAYHIHLLVKEFKYVCHLAEQKSQARGEVVEHITKYYLKPSIRLPFIDGLANQLYGNTSIVYMVQDEKPLTFKFIVNAYSDSAYTNPLPFEDMMDQLLEK